MKIASIDAGAGLVVVEAGAKDSEGNDTATQWSIPARQVEAHRPMFGALFDSLPESERARVADKLAADAAKGAK